MEVKSNNVKIDNSNKNPKRDSPDENSNKNFNITNIKSGWLSKKKEKELKIKERQRRWQHSNIHQRIEFIK